MNSKSHPIRRVLFCCMGNICRSPTAEGVFRALIASRGLSEVIEVASAGTHGYHIGEPPDSRTVAAARVRGYDLSQQRARQFEIADFHHYDLILAMDRQNFDFLSSRCPSQHGHKLRLFLSFGCQQTTLEVPDPYYGGPDGFEKVLDLVEEAAEGLLEALSV